MRKRAFTLIEVLVVIAIITTMLSILLPSLQRARGIAKRVTCMSNLRQLCVAADAYTSTNNGYYPFAQVTLGSGSSAVVNSWDFMDSKSGVGRAGLLWDGQKTATVPNCPILKTTTNQTTNPVTGYNYNASYIGGTFTHSDGIVGIPATPGFSNGVVVLVIQPTEPPVSATDKLIPSSKVTEVKHPASCALFGDGQSAASPAQFMRSPYAGLLDKDYSGGRYKGTQSFRHLGQTNVGYCDGSVSSQKQRYLQTIDPMDARMIARGNGFLSANNIAYDRE